MTKKIALYQGIERKYFNSTVKLPETIEELEEENKAYFLQAGGQHFYYLPPFNADSDFAQLVVKLLS